LPVILPLSSTRPPPSFTQQHVPPTDILPEFFSGGKPRVHAVSCYDPAVCGSYDGG
jgi:hypothetical protein